MESALRDQLQLALGNAYTIERELGGGGMSRVFVAEETAFGRRVVVKLLAPALADGVNLDRFKREINVAARLQHPHIVPVITAGESDGLPYYTMPFVDGESLRGRLARDGMLPVAEGVAVLRDVAKALVFAHERGIVHRDIKPDNVLLAGGSASVADFGIAKALDAAKTQERGGGTLTQLGTSIGTPMYMAPEQAAGDPDIDHRADIYAFGCMAYEVFTGRPPFEAKSPQRLLAAHMSEQPAPILSRRADLPAALADAVMRCLEKDPDARPRTVAEIVPLLEMSATSGSSSTAAPALLLGGRAMLQRALVTYAVAFVVVAIATRWAVDAIGLPDWVFPGAMIVMAAGLPAILFTGYAQHVARRAYTMTPTYTPGGTPSMQHGTMATMALKASPHLSFGRTSRWGAYGIGTFILLVVAAMIMRVSGVGPFATLLSAGTLQNGASIVVADFALSNSPDTTLGRVIADAVKADLGQSSAVSIVPDAQVTDALTQMRRTDTHLLLPVAQEVAQRRGAKAVVDGSLSPLGAGFVVKLRLVTADSARELASFTGAADAPSQLIGVVGGLTRKLRAKMGESLKSVQGSPKLWEVTTSSLPALRKYSEARVELTRGNSGRYLQLMREAIALDSNFASAWAALGVELSNRGGNSDEVARIASRQYELRDRLPDEERLAAELFYARSGPVAARSFSRQRALLDTLMTKYGNGPRGSSWIQSAGLMARDAGEDARADSLMRIAASRNNATSYAIGNYWSLKLLRGERAAAESLTAVLGRRFPDAATLRSVPFRLDSGNFAGIQEEARRLAESPASDVFHREEGVGTLADLALYRGRIRESDALLPTLMQARQRRGARDVKLAGVFRLANARLILDDSAGALRILDAGLANGALDSLPLLDRPYFDAATAYAEAGKPQKADMYLAGLQRQYVESDPMRGYLIRVAKAEIAVARGKPAEAAAALQGAAPGRCGNCVFLARGRVFDALGQRDSAIVAYERYLRMIGNSDWEVPGAHRRAGELYEQKGDRSKALEHYEKFLMAWKDADAELQPQVADVRRRVERLHQAEGRAR